MARLRILNILAFGISVNFVDSDHRAGIPVPWHIVQVTGRLEFLEHLAPVDLLVEQALGRKSSEVIEENIIDSAAGDEVRKALLRELMRRAIQADLLGFGYFETGESEGRRELVFNNPAAGRKIGDYPLSGLQRRIVQQLHFLHGEDSDDIRRGGGYSED